MTPGEILRLIKDGVILIVLALMVYFLITFGRDAVKVADMKAVQKQLAANAQTQAQWAQESRDADTKRSQDLAQVAAAIAAQRAPIVLRGPTCPHAVPPTAAQTPSSPSGAGGDESRIGEDIDRRPAVNAFELKYETIIADCRNALDKWPGTNKP